MHEFIAGLSILFHWSICLFLCQYHTLGYCGFVIYFEIRICDASSFVSVQKCFDSVLCDHLEAWDREGRREGDARGKRYGNICVCITD